MNPETLTLSAGTGGAANPCLQEKVSLVHAHVHGYLTPEGLGRVLTDRPCWQNEVINVVGIYVNDSSSLSTPEQFAVLDLLVPRMVAASVASDPEVERRINARLLCWLARQSLHLFEHVCPGDGRPRKAIETREAWLRGEATEAKCLTAATAAADAADAAAVAWAAAAAGAARAAEAAGAAAVTWATTVAWAAEAAGADLIRMIEELCDQHDKAKAEEGVALDDGWHKALTEAGLLETGNQL